MVTTAPFARRIMPAAGFAVAAVAAPLVAGALLQPTSTPLAQCPPGQTFDPTTVSCRPGNDFETPITNPINPEHEQLQTEAITGSQPGEVGRLPEVNGIPCNGDNTGLCIGLTEVNESLGGHNNSGNPFGN